MSNSRRVRYSELAHAYIVEISIWIGRDSESTGRRFVDAVFETAARLALYPDSGNKIAFGDASLQGCRFSQVIGFKNWPIVYRAGPRRH